MRARRFWMASIGFSALLVGWGSVASAGTDALVLPPVPDITPLDTAALAPDRRTDTRAAGLPGTSTMAVRAPASPVLDIHTPEPTAGLDVTGSVAPNPSAGAVDATPPSLPSGAPPAPAPATAAPVTDGTAVPPPAVTPPSDASAGAPIAPASVLTAADLAEALSRFVTTEPARRPGELPAQVRQRQKDREAIAAVYAGRGTVPLWIEGDHLSAAARAALSRVDRAGEDGLDLSAYATAGLRSPSVADLATAELAVSEAVVAYARQASGSRIDPLTIDRLITAKPTLPAVSEIMAAVSAATDPDAALRAFNPPQAGYAKLRDKLAELRQQTPPIAQETIPSGPTLRPGMRDARVPLIRARFGLDLPSAAAEVSGLVYDTRVAAAVAEFQRTNGLPASGILTARTIAMLSGGNPSRLENELVANMERWRWLPRGLGPDHVSVNVPDYSLEVVSGDAVVHRARVVVGKPDHQTPIFSDTMRFIIVNPYWNVPLSIINKEMMPKLAENPNYFADHGYEVVERNGTTYVRQPPGEDNALGRIKFMFPNQHSVYLHDTNARALFGKDKRAFSHGCVRVDQPFRLAEVVLGQDSGWSEARIKKLIGGNERTIMLPKPLPIHITYFTAFVDETGGLQLRDDVYGYSGRVKVALGLRD